jgi:asparagine synthase (glutamine-hydrolysing)
MCGIAGFLNLDGAPAAVDAAARMTDLQRHRGPDDQGMRLFSLAHGTSVEPAMGETTVDGAYEGALGFNRLKILDLTACGHQPMTSGDGQVVIAFNGEIYNAFDFRPELESAGYRFRSRTDTEVILYLYEHYGLEGMLERLNGMFALVIVDLRKRELLMIRDHLGVKPFYWTVAGSTLLFGSEAKSFLAHPAFVPEIDAEHLDEYLAFRYVAGEESLLKGVVQLRPGHYVRVKAGRMTTHRYWSVPDQADKTGLSDAAALDDMDHRLRESVRSQLQSDVKVGCQLSGGIDSSLVAVLARSHFDADMETFSVVFDDPAFSEQAWITQAAAVARAESHYSTFTPDFFFETIGQASWHMDQPMSHPNSLGIWLLAREARKRVTVLLSGEGADEVFGGYSRFYYANVRRKLGPFLPALRHMPGLGARMERDLGGDPAGAFINSSRFQDLGQVRDLRPGAALDAAVERRRAIFEEGSGGHLDRCLKYEMQTYLVDLLVRQDKMTMAHSVENRVPFLDKNLVGFARALPSRCLVSDSLLLAGRPSRSTKIILKTLARRFFDEAFVYRQKSGFPLPLAQYFASPAFQTLMEDQLLPGISRRAWVDAGAVRRRWQALPGASQGEGESMWIAVALELWAQHWLDRRVAREPARPAIATTPAPVARPAAAARPVRNVRVVFCWAEPSGYMAACWRALAARPGVDLHIVLPQQLFNWQLNRFHHELEGLSHEMFSPKAPGIEAWLLDAVARQRPDVVVVCGWIYWPYTRLIRAPRLRAARMMLGMDSPWRGTWTQRLGRFRLASTLRRCQTVVTAGERSATYARRLGVPDSNIRTGFYGFDYERFGTVARSRAASSGWPRQFLFLGRYVPQKDLGTLVRAYERYRQLVSDPWGLTCCGDGREGGLLANRPGITDIGFKPPSELPEVFGRHGAFVMASHFEPWGVAIAEAAASGLPLITTTACGASVDLVRPYYNGLVAAPRDVEGLARAMRWIHEHESELPVMGARSHTIAEAFSAESWAARWHNYLLEALEAEVTDTGR